MNAKSSANTMPLVREPKRERAGEHILFNARTRSKLAKQAGQRSRAQPLEVQFNQKAIEATTILAPA